MEKMNLRYLAIFSERARSIGAKLLRCAFGMVVGFSLFAFSANAETKVYVVKDNPNAAEPYNTWETAAAKVKTATIFATNLVATAALEGQDITVEVSVGAERYIEHGIYVGKNVTLRGATGNRDDVVIGPNPKTSGATNYRVITASGNGAVIADLTIINGYVYSDANNNMKGKGGGVSLSSYATITNCHITSCIAYLSATAAGINVSDSYMYDTLVDNCKKTYSDLSKTYNNRGYIVLVTGASVVDRCQIVDNTAESVIAGGSQPYGGALAIQNTSGSPSIVRNCLIARNAVLAGKDSSSYSYATGLSIRGGICENCTIVSNRSDVAGKFYGIVMENGESSESKITEWVRNCHITDNYVTGDATSPAVKQYTGRSGGAKNLTKRIVYCCMSQKDEKVATSCVLDDKTKWTFGRKGRVQLLKGSPCIDAASQQSWMVGATDLYGRDRKLYGKADIGAVEYVKPMGLSVFVR